MIVELDDLYLRLGQEIATLIAELSFTPGPKALPLGLSLVFARTPNDFFAVMGNFSPDFIFGLCLGVDWR